MAATGLIFPFDKSTFTHADKSLLTSLKTSVDIVKIGLEAWTAVDPETGMSVGYAIHQFCREHRIRTFEDWKLNDIPNTVGGAVANIAKRWPFMVTMHASAGAEATITAKHACGSTNLLVVTVLTSLDDAECSSIFGALPEQKVLQFASERRQNGADGIVCSPKELRAIKEHAIPLLTVIPGVRPEGASTGDQKRVMTPTQAAQAGADYVVCGRPISGSAHPAAAAAEIKAELRAA